MWFISPSLSSSSFSSSSTTISIYFETDIFLMTQCVLLAPVWYFDWLVCTSTYGLSFIPLQSILHFLHMYYIRFIAFKEKNELCVWTRGQPQTFKIKPQKSTVLGAQNKTALSETHEMYFPHDFYAALMRQVALQTKNVCGFNNTNIGRITTVWLCCL